MKLSKTWTTVTPLSKSLALLLFILFPFLGFYVGIQYQKLQDIPTQITPIVDRQQTVTVTPQQTTQGKYTLYTNKKLGFSFEYPKEYSIVFEDARGVRLGFSGGQAGPAYVVLSASTLLTDYSKSPFCNVQNQQFPCLIIPGNTGAFSFATLGNSPIQKYLVNEGEDSITQIIQTTKPPYVQVSFLASGAGLVIDSQEIMKTFTFLPQ